MTHPQERSVLNALHNFPTVLDTAKAANNPASICSFLHDLAKVGNTETMACRSLTHFAQSMSQWYELPGMSVLRASDKHIQATRLQFITAATKVLRKGLAVLGITVLEKM